MVIPLPEGVLLGRPFASAAGGSLNCVRQGASWPVLLEYHVELDVVQRDLFRLDSRLADLTSQVRSGLLLDRQQRVERAPSGPLWTTPREDSISAKKSRSIACASVS